MAVNKKSVFPEAEQSLAELAKALAHPARILILRTLAERRACICGEIVDVLPLSQATVSQHLAALKEAGFISGEISGVRSCYCINWATLTPALAQLEEWVAAIKAEALPDAGGKCC